MKTKEVLLDGHKFLIQKIPALKAERIFIPLMLAMGDNPEGTINNKVLIDNYDSFDKLMDYCFFVTPEGGMTKITDALCDAQDIMFTTIMQLKTECFAFNTSFLEGGTK